MNEPIDVKGGDMTIAPSLSVGVLRESQIAFRFNGLRSFRRDERHSTHTFMNSCLSFDPFSRIFHHLYAGDFNVVMSEFDMAGRSFIVFVIRIHWVCFMPFI
jgi:hypothetical protein